MGEKENGPFQFTFNGLLKVAFQGYNKRGTAEQWIKEGKQAAHWTRLS